MELPVVLLALLSACDVQNVGAGAGLELPFFALVYECDTGEDEWYEQLELCWDGSAGELEVDLSEWRPQPIDCRPTSRHAGPCIYRCPSERGCNAFYGCWCLGT